MTSLEQYPFLAEIPKMLLDEVDLNLNVLVILSSERSDMVTHLSQLLNVHLVVYKGTYQPVGRHFCKEIRFAQRTDDTLSRLQQLEKQMGKDDFSGVCEALNVDNLTLMKYSFPTAFKKPMGDRGHIVHVAINIRSSRSLQ